MAKKALFSVEEALLLNKINYLIPERTGQIPADAVSKYGSAGNPVIVASYVPASCVDNKDALIASGYLKLIAPCENGSDDSRR